MPWLQLHLETAPENAEMLEELLLEHGASAVTLRDAGDRPLYEPPPGSTPLWDQVIVTALFAANQNLDEVCAAIARLHVTGQQPAMRREILEDRVWEREWMRDYRPMQFGRRLWICPQGMETPADAEVVLPLDPGLAFGTGTHPTTRLCLEWLDAQDLGGRSVLDYGCGSGVLGLAAIKLGAEKLLAIDNDPQAVIASHDNAERMNVDMNHCSIELAGKRPLPEHDIVLANILADVLTELAPALAAATRAGGKLVLSGILADQAQRVKQRYESCFEDFCADNLDGWVRITATKRE